MQTSAHPDSVSSLIAQAMEIAPQAVRQPLARRMRPWLFAGIFLLVFLAACSELQLSIEILTSGLSKMGVILGAMWPPTDGGQPVKLLFVILQTVAMAIISTAVAVILSIPVGMLAARNLVSNPAIHYAIRRFLDLFRGIPVLVWALIMVAAFGLGPIPGILAIIVTDIPRLGKLFAEAMENVDQRQLASMRVTGAGTATILRFGTLPQMLPVWLSQCLYFLEQNFRSAAVVGVVGGGGIGFELQERIRIFAFDEVAYITLLYIVAVGVLDILSDRLRARLI